MPDTSNSDIPFPILIGWELFALALVFIGIYILKTPAEKLLQWDRRTAYYLYQTELDRSGDESRALAKAATFYKWLAYFMVGIAGIHVCVVAGLLATKLWLWFSK